MSDPGSSLPPVIPAALSQVAAAKPEQVVRIEAVRGGVIGDPSRTTRVEGEVIAISKDDRTATIRTENGNEIDIVLRGRVMLEDGQQVELDLPPGRPPQQAVMHPAQIESRIPVPASPLPPTPQNTPAADPVDVIVTDNNAMTELLHGQITLPPDMHEAIEVADRMVPRPGTDIAPVPLPPDAIVRILPLLSGLPPVLPAAQPEPVALPQTAFHPAAFKPIAPVVLIQTVSAAPQISPPVAPVPSTPLPIHSVVTFPAELIRVEMPSLEGEIHTLPPAVQTALQNLKTLIHADILSATEPLPFIQPVNSKLSVIPPATKMQGDVKSLAAFIRAPTAFITDSSLPATAEPLRFDAMVTHASPGLSIQIVPDQKSIFKTNTPINAPVSAHEISSPPSHPARGVIEARVIATSMQNFPVLSIFSPHKETPDLFMMQFPASNLPVGTELHLMPRNPVPVMQPSVIQAAPATPAYDLMTGWTWPVFEDAGTFFTQAGQPESAKAFASILPNPADTREMPPAILFLMAAVQAGDLAGWMGEKNFQFLRRDGNRSGAEILSRLTRDFAGLSRMASEPVTQDWRGMAIPMMWQNDIQKIHLHYRHQHGEKDDDSDMPAERSTRFIFDLHLTQMGEIQLDGLMKARRLDLILRTRTPLSHPMQTAMREKYLNVLDIGQLTGDLAFQNRVDQWVTVGTRPEGWVTSA